MKTLSLLQPWAGLLVLGIKRFETRSFNTRYRGRLGIHASARMPREGRELLEELGKVNRDFRPGAYKYRVCTTLGHVLGEVEVLETCSTNDPHALRLVSPGERDLGDYSPDRFFWICKNPRIYEHPIPAKGQLGFWNWENHQASRH
ncbi:ASCH domain-containing protein [Salmonirosea aquatica]